MPVFSLTHLRSSNLHRERTSLLMASESGLETRRHQHLECIFSNPWWTCSGCVRRQLRLVRVDPSHDTPITEISSDLLVSATDPRLHSGQVGTSRTNLLADVDRKHYLRAQSAEHQSRGSPRLAFFIWGKRSWNASHSDSIDNTSLPGFVVLSSHWSRGWRWDAPLP